MLSNYSQLILWAFAAVLMFWAVGAYNRLVSLRNNIARAFVPVDAQIRHRQGLIEQWIEAQRPLLDHTPKALDAVVAACGQLQTACDIVRNRPVSSKPVTSLRVAEDTLTEARNRLSAELPNRPDVLASLGLAGIGEELAAADSALGFARQQFNQAVQAYNDALQQFPTMMLTGVFRFRLAGTL